MIPWICISFRPATCEFVLYFGAESSSKQGQNSNQNKGHLAFVTCWLWLLKLQISSHLPGELRRSGGPNGAESILQQALFLGTV